MTELKKLEELNSSIVLQRNVLNSLKQEQKELIRKQFNIKELTVKKLIDMEKNSIVYNKSVIDMMSQLTKLNTDQSFIKQNLKLNNLEPIQINVFKFKGKADYFYPVILQGYKNKKVTICISSVDNLTKEKSYVKIILIGKNTNTSICSFTPEYHIKKSKTHITNFSEEALCKIDDSDNFTGCSYFQGFYIKGDTEYTIKTDDVEVHNQIMSNFIRNPELDYKVTVNKIKFIFKPLAYTDDLLDL